jgi:hypothetical protein
MKLWNREPWYLQLDSHMRFAEGWDERLLALIAASPSPKPILSTYPAAFSLGEELTEMVTRIDISGFDADGIPQTQPTPIDPFPGRVRRARFLAAGFLFAPGSLIEEVPYDPDLYFAGEEITLAIRAFTHGYDLFHPGEHIVWHRYGRSDDAKHWSDHTGDNPWHERDVTSRAKIRRLLCERFTGADGLGTHRTLEEYEDYAGIDFNLRRVQDYTRNQHEPPNPPAAPGWASRILSQRVDIRLDRNVFPDQSFEDGAFWYVGLHDDDGEIVREDVQPEQVARLGGSSKEVRIVRTVESARIASTAIVMPHSPSGGWLERIIKPVEALGTTDGSQPSIFVSIAAYRDPELAATVRDCLEKAKHPARLRFGICWQRDEGERLPEWFHTNQFQILELPWRTSRGPCWARAEIERMWDGEEWFLQLDSHHRFVEDWDARLLHQAALTGCDRPVLSTAAVAFEHGSPVPQGGRTVIRYAGFAPDGVPLTEPELLPDPGDGRPVPARFVCGHFLFAPGSYARDVRTDPKMYFAAEETTIAIRAFTHGYDLFHPGEHILWHEHSGSYRRRHWQDRAAASDARGRNPRQAARERVARFFSEPRIARFGLGKSRTIADYEAYAGMSLAARQAQDFTRANHAPPNPAASDDWVADLVHRRVTIEIPPDAAPDEAFDPGGQWYVAIRDASGNQLHRRDATATEVRDANLEGRIKLIREFDSEAEPASWMVVPRTSTSGWLAPLEGGVPESGDVAEPTFNGMRPHLVLSQTREVP